MVSTALATPGHAPRDGTQSITGAAADVIVARLLDVPDGSPVLRVEGLTHGETVPLEYYVYVCRADRVHIEASLLFERASSGHRLEMTASNLLPSF